MSEEPCTDCGDTGITYQTESFAEDFTPREVSEFVAELQAGAALNARGLHMLAKRGD